MKSHPMSWSESSAEMISYIHSTLPPDVTFAQRVKALRDGYPFARRRGWAYKAWLGEQRKYLAQYQPADHDSQRFPMSPLERLMNGGVS